MLEPGEITLTRPSGRIKWRRIASTDVERLRRQGDAPAVLAFMPDVAYGDAGERIDLDLDPALANAFGLQQYAAQYLLGCGDKLKSVIADREHELATLRASITSKEQQERKQRITVRRMKKERARLDELLEQYKVLVSERERRTLEEQRAQRDQRQRAMVSSYGQPSVPPPLIVWTLVLSCFAWFVCERC